MKATVYYIRLSDEQVKTINKEGWDSELGAQYLAAKDGKISPANRDLFEKAAVLNVPTAEAAWVFLQNVVTPWPEKTEGRLDTLLSVETDFPRSMDIGDLVVWEDGRRIERCATVGFEDFEKPLDVAPFEG